MKKILMIVSLACVSTVPAFSATEQPKTSDAKETVVKAEKTDKAKETTKASKKSTKHSRKHSDTPKAN